MNMGFCRRIQVVAPLALAIAAAVPGRTDVVETAELFLAERRIDFGYNAEARSCAFIGTSERTVHVPVSSPNFLVARNAAVKAAERNARAEIMKVVSATMSGARAARLETDGAKAVETTRTLVDVFSMEPLHGCETLCVQEEKDGDLIRVAVAVKWSAAAEAEARAAKRGDIHSDAPSGVGEWKEWAGTFDFAHAGCSATFVGSDGIRRWVGIGYADIEGKRGLAASAAMHAARQSAGAELAYALFGDAEAQSVARRLREEASSRGGETVALTADEFENRVALAVKGKMVRDSEVHTATIVHPLTGRKLFVSVAGVEPETLAEMKLLDAGP